MWSVHIVEYYSAPKRKEILARSLMWVNLEHIMLSEIDWSREEYYYVIPLK